MIVGHDLDFDFKVIKKIGFRLLKMVFLNGSKHP
jgi:hypothetical protein